jgi:D-sedoheptulose 7-phosphate isomerase
MILTKDSWPEYSSQVSQIYAQIDSMKIAEAILQIRLAVGSNSTIWVFGNGGSAATASHFCVDLSKGASGRIGKNIRAIPLMDLVPIQSAWSNDLSYHDAMAMSLKGQARDGDLVIVVTGSGNSINIINVVKMARKLKLGVIGMTGFDGGEVRKLLDFEIHVPSVDMQVVEDCHHTVCHFISKAV